MKMRPSLALSVVMPFYKNERTFARSLASFDNQTVAPEQYELVVIDDGASGVARSIVDQVPHRIAVTVLEPVHCGQTAATNLGVQNSKGQIILLSCADIYAAPDLVARHLSHHTERKRVGVLGYIPYDKSVPKTPFMAYLGGDGPQFAFGKITNPRNISPFFVYAPNFSLRLDLLQELGSFDEQFDYGYQDSDLGLRLHQRNVRIIYDVNAVGYHDHPIDLGAFVARQRRIAPGLLKLAAKYPQAVNRRYFGNELTRLQNDLAKIPTLLAQANDLETRLLAKGAWENVPESLQKKLFQLYDTILHIAFIGGIAEQKETTAHLFGVEMAPNTNLSAQSPQKMPRVVDENH